MHGARLLCCDVCWPGVVVCMEADGNGPEVVREGAGPLDAIF